jgi:hypothetical protein
MHYTKGWALSGAKPASGEDIGSSPINKEEHLAHLKAKQDIGGKFVAVSWIAKFIHKTINYEGIICPLTPLIITPLFLDTNYNSIGFTDTATIITLIKEYARDLPPPVAVAQFYDHMMETDLPKWL